MASLSSEVDYMPSLTDTKIQTSTEKQTASSPLKKWCLEDNFLSFHRIHGWCMYLLIYPKKWTIHKSVYYGFEYGPFFRGICSFSGLHLSCSVVVWGVCFFSTGDMIYIYIHMQPLDLLILLAQQFYRFQEKTIVTLTLVFDFYVWVKKWWINESNEVGQE